MTGSARSIGYAVAALGALAVGDISTSFAQQVGTASAVNPAATINARTIVIGSSIAHKERVQTQANGSVQILFVDKTSMTIGPNSDITIDSYVFDPKAGTGALSATVGKGAMRFVGGLISHTGQAEVRTANATIGIRGGVALINGPNVYIGYGSSTVTSGGASVTLAAGEFTTTAPGAPPTPPGPPPPGYVQAQVQVFQSAAGQTGGVKPGTASQRNVAAAESRATGSPNASVAGSLTPAPPVTNTAVNATQTTNNLRQTVQTSSSQAAVIQTVGDQPLPPPIDLRPTVTLSGYAGGLDRFGSGRQNSYSPVAGLATVALDATSNRVQADFTAFGNTVDTFQYGSLDPNNPTESSYTNYNNFSAKSKVGGTFNGIGYTGTTSNVSPAALREAVGNPNLTVCECDYTRWGFWTATNPTNTETIFGSWVAGRPTQIADVPTTGRATYAGHVMANVVDTGASNAGQRLVGGNFTNTVDFGARTGNFTINNLDQTNYTGTVSLSGSDVRNFSGTLVGDIGNRSAVLGGSFFRGPTSPVGEIGGVIGLGGTNYVGGGIFAGALKR